MYRRMAVGAERHAIARGVATAILNLNYVMPPQTRSSILVCGACEARDRKELHGVPIRLGRSADADVVPLGRAHDRDFRKDA